MKKIFLISFFTLCSLHFTQLSAQYVGFGVEGGYTYNKKNLGYVGGSLAFYPGAKQPYGGHTVNMITLGFGGYMGRFSAKGEEAISKYTSEAVGQAIPALSLSFSQGGVALLDYKATVTPYYVTPTIGINMLNILKIQTGYSIGLKKYKGNNMAGFNIGIVLSIPLSRHYMIDVSN